ncbi:3-oxoacyl-ACP reductase FabG [Psychrobacillus sp. NPDC058041]|uniref:3-oxoacyl-ACP reductase FabG n=1 Tax=Psychrobacillus sp. NPDC058041 TaxID=3346310 RepID=UPI0036DB85EB
MRLNEKVAIITGAANGIGLAAAQRFAEEGAKVVLADYDEISGSDQAEALVEQGAKVKFIQVDVADRESVDSLIQKTIDHYGKIDILVNNAGITRDAMLTKMTEEDFSRVLDVNLKGVFHCTQAVVPYLIAQGFGKIINTSSVTGVYGNVGQTNYAASKAAVIGMTKTWAKELGRKGINVNAVAPGFTRTAMVEKMPDKIIDQMKSVVALQRLADPKDIANAYLFLASDESSYVHGHVLQVDGGIMM